MSHRFRAKIRAAAEKANTNDPDEAVQLLVNHMTTQEQAVESLTIDDCWAKINNLYEAVEGVYSGS